jgi:hypothetical protein
MLVLPFIHLSGALSHIGSKGPPMCTKPEHEVEGNVKLEGESGERRSCESVWLGIFGLKLVTCLDACDA